MSPFTEAQNKLVDVQIEDKKEVKKVKENHQSVLKQVRNSIKKAERQLHGLTGNDASHLELSTEKWTLVTFNEEDIVLCRIDAKG